ncbi:UDP-N-acetylmuramoyl-tripeptide--D-alanyl-D-alanine ligase [Candidatus Parcubacteria bacterium]|nr:UDP-N-acetylmuramoyl-tripeptide--D-alanyl-D-alanine ligase [Candidatus Parcubacteria bacterium]
MSIILITILILFLIKIVRDSLFCVWLWQVKEYRIDRMKSYLRDEKSIIYKNINYLFVLILFFICILVPQPFGTMELMILIYLTLLFFTFTFYQILIEIKDRILKRPKLTFKIILIFFIEATFYFSFFVFYWIPAFAGMTRPAVLILLLLFIYLITPFLIATIILLTNPFFNFQKRIIKKKATEKMKGLKKVKVIGITGSYGKTSTKEFLYAILNQKYKVVKTEGNNNTNIGVAYTVLNKVSDKYDYFICEMGAYKIGEIAEICKIVKPEVGILTGINEQHIDLFGSIENTVKAKFELIEALPENGLAVINEKLKNQNGKLQFKIKNVKYFSLNNVNDIKVCQDYVGFNYKNYKFKTNLLGKHYIENILSAIMIAECLGISLDEIAKAVEKIKPTEFMIRKLYGPNNSIFIDDSYSANPDGVIAALDYLDEAYQDYKKIIVFPGIIELGNKSKEVHQKLFSKIDKICDFAYILNTEYRIQNTNNKFVFEKDFNKVARMLKNNLNEKSVVLFESRGAGVAMGKVKIEK